MARLLSLKDQKALEAMIRLHIKLAPSKSHTDWNSGDADEVCAKYEEFLVAVAKTGHRLDSKVFLNALKEVYACEVPTLVMFAKAMGAALSYARIKVRYVRQGPRAGTKVEPAVLSIVQAYKASEGSPMDDIEEVTDIDLEEVTSIPIAATDATTVGSATASLEACRMLFAAPAQVAAQPQRTLQRVMSIASSAASPQKQPEEAAEEKSEDVLERQVFY